VITVRDRSRDLEPIRRSLEARGGQNLPDWLTLAPEERRVDITRPPERQEMETSIDEQLIVEYYSR
jgi:small subunit ribosomal protein S4